MPPRDVANGPVREFARAERIPRDERVRVDAMELKQIDRLDAQPAEASLAPARRCSGRPFVFHTPGPGLTNPAFVAMTSPCGYGCRAAAMISSDTNGPYESAVSMKFTPSSSARVSTRRHSSKSAGAPQTPAPVMRIAPKPSRLTVNVLPRVRVPAWAAGRDVIPAV